MPRKPAKKKRPIILVDADERRVADEALEALAEAQQDAPAIFARGNRLVRVVEESDNGKALLRPDGAPRIVAVTAPILREALASSATFVDSRRHISPPPWVTGVLLDRGDWPELPRLRAIVDAPQLRADGSITPCSGYDAATELVIRCGCPIDVPEAPTLEDAMRARDELLEPFVDFPFEAGHHRAAAIAAVLTLFARHSFKAPVPLFGIDKNTRGAGGTLLADAIGIIATGRDLARMAAPKNAEEERKKITTVVLSGDSLVLFDNVPSGHQFGYDGLDQALTGTEWRDRLLGVNADVKGPLVATWFATGNNIEYGADTLRRVCPMRLASPEERPEERDGFRHHPLRDWIKEERPRLVGAALTILRAYCVAERPDMKLKPWGSFETWSRLVRNAVVWVGLDDPGLGRSELADVGDTTKNAVANLLAAWRDLFGDAGASAASALESLESSKGEIDGGDTSSLRKAITTLVPTRSGELPTARALGAALRRERDRVIGKYALRARGKSNDGQRWTVSVATSASDSGDSGDSFSTQAKNEEG